MRHLQIVKYKYLWLGISIALIVPGLIALMLGWLRPGLDFTGGTLIELRFEKPVTAAQISDTLREVDAAHYGDAKIQPADDIMSIRTKAIDDKQQTAVFNAFEQKLGEFSTERVEVVGPTIGSELFTNSMIGFALVIAGIIAYLTFRFKYDYAICAIISLVHDVIFVVGIFAIMGKFFGTEVDSLFVTAVLTVAGFSVHDTIVVFDRIRENLSKSKRDADFETVANDGINQTLARSINTSITTMITLLTLYLFGGVSIKDFTLAMLIGIAIGTYSSIFVATPMLVVWRDFFDKGKNKVKAKTA